MTVTGAVFVIVIATVTEVVSVIAIVIVTMTALDASHRGSRTQPVCCPEFPAQP